MSGIQIGRNIRCVHGKLIPAETCLACDKENEEKKKEERELRRKVRNELEAAGLTNLITFLGLQRKEGDD